MGVRNDWTITPESVIQQLKQGNRLAFNTLFENQWESLYQSAYKFLLDEDLAKDCVQEVFYNLWVRRDVLDISNLSGYLYKAVRHQCLKNLRRAHLQNVHEEKFQNLLQVNTTEEELKLNQLQDELEKALQSLPEKYRLVFEMSRVQNLSNKEIARKLNLSPRTVDWYLHTVIQHLKTALASAFVVLFQ